MRFDIRAYGQIAHHGVPFGRASRGNIHVNLVRFEKKQPQQRVLGPVMPI